MNSFFNRYSSMFANSWILTLLSFFLLISCKDTKLIENKNGQGLVIERFQVIKEKDVEVKHGLYERFDDQGRLIEQSHYVKGKLEGSRKLFENGVLESEETRIADQFHGPYKAYHPNGQLRMEANYIHDVITGDVKVYYPDGKLKEIVRFADNVENGPFKEYYENGNLKAEGQYIQLDNGVENVPAESGELKLYDTTGILIRIMNCESGKCITTWAKDTTSVH